MTRKRISFRVGIIQVFLALTVLVAGAVSFNFYLRVSDAVLDLSDQITTGATRRVIDNTRNFLAGPAAYTEILAAFLESSGKQERLVRDQDELLRLMWKPLLITPQMQSLFYADARGSYLQVRRGPELAGRVIDRSGSPEGSIREVKVYRDEHFNLISEKSEETDFDPRTRNWYTEAKARGRFTWSGPFISSTARTAVLAASQPILAKDGQVQGVVGVHLPTYAIADILAALPLAPEESLFLVDEKGLLLAHPRKKELFAGNRDGSLRPRRLAELGQPYADLAAMLGKAPPGMAAMTLRTPAGTCRVLRQQAPAALENGSWTLVWIGPPEKAEAAAASLPEWSARIFAPLVEPAVQVRQLAARLVQGAAPLAVGPRHEQLWRELWQPMVAMPHIQSLFIADGAGSFVQVRREPFLATRLIDRSSSRAPVRDRLVYRDEDFEALSTSATETDFDPRARPWYRTADARDRATWSDIYVSNLAQTPVVAATRVVLDRAGGKAGAVGVNIPLYKISDFVAESRVSPQGIMMIFDGAGQVVAYPRKEQILFPAEDGALRLRQVAELDNAAVVAAYRARQEKPQERRFSFDVEGVRHIAVVQPFPQDIGQKDWSILVVIPESDLLGAVHRMLFQSALITGAIVLAAILAAWWLAQAISRPIIRLAAAMGEIRDLRLDRIEEVDSRFTEIDRMSQSMLAARDGLRSFEKYVPAELVRQLIQTRQSARLGGEAVPLAILFTDVEGFTGIAETMEADALMRHLSEYLDALSRVILEQEGTIDKFIGDAIMAFWGAPLPHPRSSFLACAAAWRCLARLEELNARWQGEGKPAMVTRFGIHAGLAIVGNVGSQQRLNYTAMGDNVNLASRLEGLNKFYGTAIIISEEVHAEVGASFHCRLLDRVAVKGKQRGTRIYELLGPRDQPLPPARARFVAACEEGLAAWWARDWQAATRIFQDLAETWPEDRSVALYLERSRRLEQEAASLPADWDGTHAFQEK